MEAYRENMSAGLQHKICGRMVYLVGQARKDAEPEDWQILQLWLKVMKIGWLLLKELGCGATFVNGKGPL
eukprot:7550006-Prorocentrum_lima.AAC.1